MAESSMEIFERCCRLCAEEQEVTIMLFSEQAEAMLLQNKLHKYLLIQIEEDDNLPKRICINCCSKLQTVCEFIESAHQAQEVLAARSMKLDINQQYSNVDNIKIEPLDFDDDTHITQMEISIDPMMVLQNSNFPSPKVNEKICDDVQYLNEGEDVTIKLIRKGSGQADTEFTVVDSPEIRISTSKPFPCPICRRSFMTDIALKNHSWVHPKEEECAMNFTCSMCSKKFKDRLELVSHMKVHRLKGTCTICGRVFRSEVNLAIHIDSHSAPENAYICKVCGRSYDKISNLKTHSVSHSNDRPFKCHLCKASFKRNQDLKFHINQHTGARPYKCPFCDKRFASSGNCYSHRSRMHPGRKPEPAPRLKRWIPPKETKTKIYATNIPEPTQTNGGLFMKYQCNVCDHSFMKRDNYAYHMYQHTGRKPFQCTLCPEQFVTRKGLYLHHGKEHPANKRPLGLISKNALLK